MATQPTTHTSMPNGTGIDLTPMQPATFTSTPPRSSTSTSTSTSSSPNRPPPLVHSTSLAALYPAPTPPLPETPNMTTHTIRQTQTFSPVIPDNRTLSAACASGCSLVASPTAKVAWRRKLVLVLVGLPARGKCWGANTRMLMYDGRTKAVQDIIAGDVLMGDDSTPRIVQPGSVHSGHTKDDPIEPKRMRHIRIGHDGWNKTRRGLIVNNDTEYECKYEGCTYTTPNRHDRIVHERNDDLHFISPEYKAATYRITSHDVGRDSWTCNGHHILVLKFHSRPTNVRVDESADPTRPYCFSYYQTDPLTNIVFERIDRFATYDAAVTAQFHSSKGWTPLVWEGSVNTFMQFTPHVKSHATMFQPDEVNFHSTHTAMQKVLSDLFAAAGQTELDGAGVSRSRCATPAETESVAWAIGMWLTNGVAGTNRIAIPNGDMQLLQRLKSVESMLTRRSIVDDEEKTADDDGIFMGELFKQLLSHYNLLTPGAIPFALLTDSRSIRSALLAGVVSSGGCVAIDEKCLTITTHHTSLIPSLTRLARSLGYFTSNNTLLKGASMSEDVLNEEWNDPRSQRFTIEMVEHAPYYGFTLDGNGRCIMEDFVVTHNSYIAYKLLGYLRWRGLNASLFNVGKHRRHVAEKISAAQSSEFFSPDNASAKAQRDEIAMEVLECMLDWLADGGDVSIFDATNTTAARRQAVLHHCQSRSLDLRVIFLESICDDARVLENNYKVKVANSPDYKDIPMEEALIDLKRRVENYEKIYESITDDELSYIKLHNLASKVICNKIHGQLSHSIAAYLMSIHLVGRPIFFVRAGHSESDRVGLEIVGQQFQDRQILKLPPETLETNRTTEAQTTTTDANMNDNLNPPTAISSGSLAQDFHIPYAVAMAANLDQHGKSFASRLNQFITHKVDEYTARLHATSHATPGAPAGASNLSPPSHPPSSSSSSPVPSAAPTLHACVSNVDPHLPLVVYTSTLPRAIQTAATLKDRAYIFEPQSSLNMMDTGVCSGMSIQEIRDRMPQELDRWQKHKYKYRFPGGESQADRAKSLEPLVFELERQTMPVLVISHMSTLQVLMGYFWGSKRSVDSYYSLWIPQHTVLELIPSQYGWQCCEHNLSEEACADDGDWATAGGDGLKPSSLPGSPKHHPIPKDLDTEGGEVERFNLQVVASRERAADSANGSDGAGSDANDTVGHLGLAPPRGLMAHDRSVSIPPIQSTPPLPGSGQTGEYSRKGGIGKSSSIKNLGDTNFYDAHDT